MYLLFYMRTLYTLLAVALLFAAAAFFAFFKRRETAVLIMVGMSAMISVCGFLYINECTLEAALAHCGENIAVSGTLSEYPYEEFDNYVYTLKSCTIAGQETDITINLKDDVYYDCKPGNTLSFTASTIKAECEEGARYYLQSLADGVFIKAYVSGPVDIYENIYSNSLRSSRLVHAADYLCFTIMECVSARLEENNAAILTSLILGETDGMDFETELAFQLSGVAHLFSVSGFHISFWASLFLAGFGRRKRHKLPCILVSLFIVFYMALTGFSVSVCRAGIMALVIFAGNLFKRPADSLNSLGLAIMILLLQNPYAAADASLLLSAGATAAILISAEPTERFITIPIVSKFKTKSVQKGLRYVLNMLFLSVFVTVAIMPLTSFWFGSVSLLTPLANLLCIPLSEVTMVSGLLSIAVNPIPYLSDFLFHLTEVLLRLLIFVTEKLAAIPFAVYTLDNTFTIFWSILTAAILLVAARHFNRQPKKTFSAALACLCALFFCFNLFAAINKDKLTLTVYNVNNGLCISLHDNSGNAAILGCAGTEQTVEAVVQSLKTAGIRQPRLLLIPNADTRECADGKQLQKFLHPQTTISAVALDAPSEPVILAQSGTVDLWENVQIQFEFDPKIRAARLQMGEKVVVICDYPSADFSDTNGLYASGDILICRQSIPVQLPADCFSQIIISSDKKEELYYFTPALGEKTITTADDGHITITN